MRSKDSAVSGGVELALAMAILVLCVVAVSILFAYALTGGASESGSAAADVETAPGMPLDAVQYAAPSWSPDARQCFCVVDRISGCSWWVIQVPGYGEGEWEWLVLPIEGKVENIG